MPLILLLALACRQAPSTAPPDGPPTPDDGSTTTSTEPKGTRTTADTASTTRVTPTGQTSSTGDTHPTAADTGATATTGATAGTGSTSDTGVTSPTAHTGPATSHTGASATTGTTGRTGSTADTASVSTGDTALPCGWLPDSWPAEPEDPYLVDDTGVTCPPDDTSDTASTPLACPQIDWVLTATGAYQQSIVDVLTLSDGDIMVIGTDQAAITLAQGRPDEVTIPVDCSSDYTSWFARVDPDGTVEWGKRLTSSCESGQAFGAMATPADRVLVWGRYFSVPNTIGEGSSSPITLPTPDRFDYWWALLEEDGTPVIARAIHDSEAGVYIDRMTVDTSGAIYAIGRMADDDVTFNKGEPDELILLRPAGAINPEISWIAAWEPNGDLRWAKLEGVVYGGGGSLPGLVGGDLKPYYGMFEVVDGHLTLTAQHDGHLVYDACGEHETAAREWRYWHAVMDINDGSLAQAPTSTIALTTYGSARSPSGTNYYIGKASSWTPHMSGVSYATGEGGIWVAEDDGTFVGPFIRQDTELTGLAVRDLQATEDSLVLLGTGVSDANAQYAFHCSDVIDGPDVQLYGNGGAAMWWLFTSELEQVCGGTLGPSTHITFADSGVTFDGDGGLVFGTSIDDAFTFDEGGPNETHVDPDDVDAVIVRLAPP
jgi:hypothetical protein